MRSHMGLLPQCLCIVRSRAKVDRLEEGYVSRAGQRLLCALSSRSFHDANRPGAAIHMAQTSVRSRLLAAVHQGLLCEPEVGEVRLEEGDASPGPDGTCRVGERCCMRFAVTRFSLSAVHVRAFDNWTCAIFTASNQRVLRHPRNTRAVHKHPGDQHGDRYLLFAGLIYFLRSSR